MKTNCKDCKFNGDRACAVNPNYWEVEHLVDGPIPPHIKSAVLSFLPDSCSDFEQVPLIKAEILLTFEQWKELAHTSAGKRILGEQIPQEARDAVEADKRRNGVESEHAVSERVSQLTREAIARYASPQGYSWDDVVSLVRSNRPLPR